MSSSLKRDHYDEEAQMLADELESWKRQRTTAPLQPVKESWAMTNPRQFRSPEKTISEAKREILTRLWNTQNPQR
jgi:hypothetical protein